MSDDTSSHVRVSHLYDELLLHMAKVCVYLCHHGFGEFSECKTSIPMASEAQLAWKRQFNSRPIISSIIIHTVGQTELVVDVRSGLLVRCECKIASVPPVCFCFVFRFVHLDLVTSKSRPNWGRICQLLQTCQLHPLCKFGERVSVSCRYNAYLFLRWHKNQ